MSATTRLSDSSLETPWREDAEQLRYAPPHWSCTGYYGMGRYWISLSRSSSTHCRFFYFLLGSSEYFFSHLIVVGSSVPAILLPSLPLVGFSGKGLPYFSWDRRLTTWSKQGLEFGGFPHLTIPSGYAGDDLQVLDVLFGTIVIKSFGVKREPLYVIILLRLPKVFCCSFNLSRASSRVVDFTG
ncbi:hypothetical protein TNCV_3106601 [Trichonephila clavipes]|nr:hypothetical protein TNCV_3106601 [Trichonephila clavipes]